MLTPFDSLDSPAHYQNTTPFLAATLASPPGTMLCTHDPVVLRRCPPTVTPAIRTQRTVVAPMATSVSTELPRELVLDP
jgi:hypothetical protein